MKTFFSFIIYSFYALILIGMAILFVAPPLPGIGAFDVKIVKSGSMEPSIMTGAIVMVQESPNYGLNDVITFSSEDSVIPTTHRIVGTENVGGIDYFVTKGDANEERDANLVAMNDILGKVKFDIPYIGFIFDFARQPIGFALLIGLPAFLIIVDELDKIWREVRRVRQMKITKEMIMPLVIAPYQPLKNAEVEESVKKPAPVIVAKARMMDIKPVIKELEKKPALSLKNKLPVLQNSQDIKSRFAMATAGFVMFVVVSGQTGVGDSLSYFSDTEASSVNGMEAQALDFTVSPENSNFSILDGVFDGENGLDVVVDDKEKNLLYKVGVDFVSGTTTLCDDILVEADEPLVFSGSLPSLIANNLSFSEPWHLDFSLIPDSDYVSGDTCVVDLSFAGYNNESEDLGYVDTEKVILTFTAINSIIKDESIAPAPENTIMPTSFMIETVQEEVGSTTEDVVTDLPNIDEPTEVTELNEGENETDDFVEVEKSEQTVEEKQEILEVQVEDVLE